MKGWRWAALLAVILAIIALIARYRVIERIDNPGAWRCKENLQVLARAVDRYTAEHDGKSPGMLEQLLPRYLPAVPTCPASRRPSYGLFSGFTAPRTNRVSDSYYLFCHGLKHDGYQRDYPAYSKDQGMLSGPPNRKWRR